MSTSAIFRTWLRRIDADQATVAQIRQLAAVSRGDGSGHRTNLTTEEAHQVTAAIAAADGIHLEPGDRDKGLAWLRRWGTKRLGVPAEAVELAVDFTWTGEVVYYADRTTLPVWTVHLSDGRRFRYWAASWQSRSFGYGHTTDQDEDWWWARRHELEAAS